MTWNLGVICYIFTTVLILDALNVKPNIASPHFNTYVINLQHEQFKYNIARSNLIHSGFNKHHIFRYEGTLGKKYIQSKNNSLDHYITPMCRMTCAYGIIGIGLSHYTLLESIKTDATLYCNSEKDNQHYKYALILEDDAIPYLENILHSYYDYNTSTRLDNNIQNTSINVDLASIINNIIIPNAPSDWDVIMLHCFEMCRYHVTPPTYSVGNMIASTAAYLINLDSNCSAINKIIVNNPIYGHIDGQNFKQTIFNPRKLNVYKAPVQLFDTNKSFGSSTSGVAATKKANAYDSGTADTGSSINSDIMIQIGEILTQLLHGDKLENYDRHYTVNLRLKRLSFINLFEIDITLNQWIILLQVILLLGTFFVVWIIFGLNQKKLFVVIIFLALVTHVLMLSYLLLPWLCLTYTFVQLFVTLVLLLGSKRVVAQQSRHEMYFAQKCD